MLVGKIDFPEYSGVRCLMMPFIQGDSSSLPEEYKAYADVVDSMFIDRGKIGYLTIDESKIIKGIPHRGARAKFKRALHTEAGKLPNFDNGVWGGGYWGASPKVQIERDVKVLLANNIDNSCALWDAWHENTSKDGDIGDFADMYPYTSATMMLAGEVHEIGIFTPHESLPSASNGARQFIRIVGDGVHGREDYFTNNYLM